MKQTPNAMDDRKSNHLIEYGLNGSNHDSKAMDNPPIWHRRETGAKFEDDSMDYCMKDVVHKNPTLFMFFNFYEAWKKRKNAPLVAFSFWFNDPKKDIKV